MEIKFSHRYSKLMTGKEDFGFCKRLCLLDVVNVKLEDLSESFLDYDTDEGTFELPKKGDYMMLLFKKETTTHLLTTLRRRTPDKEKYYRSAIGQWFNVVYL
jgi:hypothetical protein